MNMKIVVFSSIPKSAFLSEVTELKKKKKKQQWILNNKNEWRDSTRRKKDILSLLLKESLKLMAGMILCREDRTASLLRDYRAGMIGDNGENCCRRQ